MARQTATAQRSGSKFRFVGENLAELKKVVWLSKREVTYLTVLVLIVSLVAGLILGVIDYGFSGLVDKILLGR